jgi:hypothetical protein
MKSKLYQQRIDEALDSVPIEQGGTAARTKETACENLGLVSKDQVRGPGGIIILGEDGLISKSDLPPDILNNDLPSLFGPQDVELGATVPYYITNYASDVQYDITVSGGTFTRDVDCIFFTAQETSTQGSIQVNARTFPLWIGPPKPMRPVILTPEAGLEQGPFVKFTASDYIARKSGDLHAGSEWQVSTTIGFDVIVAEGTITELAKLKAWTSSRLERDTQYFARVRYLGSLGGVSEWSVPHLLKTRVSFIPEFYMATVGSEAYDGAVRWRSVDIDGVGDRVILGDPTVDEDPNYDTGAIRIFRRAGQDFVEEATMLDHPLSLNTEIRLQIPVGGVVEMTTDSELTGNQTYTASTVFYAPSDASYVTLVGKGTDAIETLAVKPQQGLLAYPEGLPVYNAGQAAVAETGDMYYPDGLPVYVPAQLGGVPEYPDGLPPYDPFGTDGGVWEYPDGLPPYDPAFPRIPQQGSPDYPNGLPPYDDGQAYIAPTGHPSYPNGLPPYEPAGQVYIPGDAASVSYNGQTYLFPGGQDGRATFTTVTLNFLANQSEHYFGKEVSLSKDGKVAAASGNTSVWKGLAADLKIPPGAQIEFNIFSPDPVVETYFQDSRVGIPKDAYQVELTGKGAPGEAGTVVPAATQTLSASGSVTVPKGVRLITATGKGGPGSVILSTPQVGLPEYPNGLPVYNAGQPYIAPTGNPSYPSGLTPYDPGQAYVAPTAPVYGWNTSSAYASTTPTAAYPYSTIAQVTTAFGVPSGDGQSKSSGYSIQETGTYYTQYTVTSVAYQVTAYSAGQPYIAPIATTYKWKYAGPIFVRSVDIGYGEPVSKAQALSTFLSTNGSAPLSANSTGSYLYGEWEGGSDPGGYWYEWRVTVTAVVDVQGTPGQPYIAPTDATFAWGTPTITQTATGVTSNSFAVVAAADDAMNTAGTPTAAGQTFSRNVATSYGDTQYKNYTVSATSYTDTAGSPGQPYIAPSGNPSYPGGLPAYNPGQPYIPSTGNPSYPSGLQPYSPAGVTNLMGPDSTFTINGQSYIFPGGKGTDPAIEKAYDITLPGLTALEGIFTIATGGSGKVAYENGVIPNRTIAPLNTTVTRDGSIGISRAITTLTLRGKGQDGTRTTVTAQQGLPEYPNGLPVYNAGQSYIAPAGLPAYPTGLPPYNAGQAYVAPTGDPNYPNGLPVYNAGQPYIAPTGSSSYPNGLPPYNPGQPYIAPTAAVYGWSTTETFSSTTTSPPYAYNLLSQVISAFGVPTGNGQTKSGGYSVQEAATLYSNYSVSSVAYQATAYNPGQPYIAPKATTYKWSYSAPLFVGTSSGEYGEPTSEGVAYSNFHFLYGQTPPGPNSAGSYEFGVWSPSGETSSYFALYQVTVTAVVDVQGTPGQPYIAPTAATFAWGTPTVTMTATDQISTGLPVVMGVSDAMSTAGTPTYTGQTFNRSVATSYAGTVYKNYAVSGTSYTVTAATPGQVYIAPVGSSSYPSGLPTYNPGQSYIAPSGNVSYPSGLPVYNAGQPYIAPTGNPSYPSGLPPYSAGQPLIAATGNVNYPSGLPVYKPAVITTTSGQNTTFTINGQTYTFQGGQDGASATSRIETVTLPGTVDQTGVYTVPMGGSIEISHYGGTVAGNAVPALNLEIVNTGYLTLESGLTVLEVTLKGGDGEIAIVEPEQGLLQFPNGLPRYVPGSSPQVGDSRYPDGLPIYRQATAKTIKGQDSTFTINGQTYIFEGGNGQPATERTEVIQLPGTSTLTATYAVAENVIGMVKHAAYEVWISAGYPAIARINNTIYVFPGGETGSAPVTTHSVPLVSSWNVGSVSTTLRTGESWSPPSVLTPEVDQEHLFFGTSISLDGTGLRMAVSGPGYDQSKGAVWLYVREDGYWKREAFLTPKDLNANDLFGQSVCLSQDGLVLAIGAPQHQQRGAVYLYQRIQGTWYFQAKVMADDPQQTDDFGTSVSLNSDGRILAVGAPGRDYAKPVYEWDRVTEKDQIVYFTTYDNAGAAFTFQYSQGVWSQTAELRRSEAPGMPISFTNNHFGTSVSLDGLGTALVVGVPGSDYGYGGMGVISTYIAQGPTWTFYKEVKPDSYSMGTLFARRLRMAASGQYMIANANGSHIVDGQYIQGASLVFSVEERAASTPLPPIMLS